jgi:hypothetical protein
LTLRINEAINLIMRCSGVVAVLSLIFVPALLMAESDPSFSFIENKKNYTLSLQADSKSSKPDQVTVSFSIIDVKKDVVCKGDLTPEDFEIDYDDSQLYYDLSSSCGLPLKIRRYVSPRYTSFHTTGAKISVNFEEVYFSLIHPERGLLWDVPLSTHQTAATFDYTK